MKKRYLSDQPQQGQQYIDAAQAYVDHVNEALRPYLYLKPYDPTPGSNMLFHNMYDTLSLVQAMHIPPGGRVLDVGCGAGWLDELLFGMSYEVTGIDPSEDFLTVARERVVRFAQQHHLPQAALPVFHQAIIETCPLESESFDAIIFYAALHHVVDEHAALHQCFRLLKPGGVLGIHEAAWQPGDRIFEATLDREMAAYGTLENPFTVEYLDAVLAETGFTRSTRYYQHNGLVPLHHGHLTVAEVAQGKASAMNIVTARKPFAHAQTSAEPEALAQIHLQVTAACYDAELTRLYVTVIVQNTGSVVLLGGAPDAGTISLALRSASMHEARNRLPLPQALLPADRITLQGCFVLPADQQIQHWLLDAVCEQHYWFSQRGLAPVSISIDL